MGMEDQMPKSTPLLSFLTIHLKYMFNLLAAEPFDGFAMCFLLLISVYSPRNVILNLKIGSYALFDLLKAGDKICSNESYFLYISLNPVSYTHLTLPTTGSV